LLAPGSDPAPARRLATLLDAQGIEVERARGPLLARRAADADGRVEELRKLPEGTLIVPLAQPEAALARAILEARSGLAPAVLEEERRRAAAGRPTTFYDVTAWSLPLCFGLEVYQTPVPAEGPRASAAEPEPAAAPPAAPDPAAAAHAIRADAPGALRAAVGLLSAGARLLVLGTRQKLDGQELPPGSLVLPAGGGVPVERLAAVARASGAPLVPLRRLFPDEGPGLGSASVTEVRLPLVAVLAERPTSATSVGGLRFALEEAGLAPTLVPVDAVGGARLRDWDALVVPDADPGALRATLGDGGVAALRAWVADGGTLVAVKGGAVFCGQEGVDLAATKLRRKFPRKETTPDGKTVEVEREEPPVRVPGALLRTVVGDPTHFLAWGLGAEVTVQVTTDFVFTGGSGRGVVLAFAAADRLVRSGALPEEARPRLAGSPYLVEESRGRGRVVLFLDDPGFRAFFPPLERALLAAVLFGRR
jgi:hypothetical protein